MENLENMTDFELISYSDAHMMSEPAKSIAACKILLQRTNSQKKRMVVLYNIACLYRDDVGIQNLIESFRYMRQAAESGHCGAQLNLGSMYKDGIGVEKNTKESIYWFERAANQGDVDAQYSLGIMYQSFVHNYTKARYWYEKAIDDACAKYNLGHMYENGQGVEIDLRKALSLYNQAAAQGLNEAKIARLRLIRMGIN